MTCSVSEYAVLSLQAPTGSELFASNVRQAGREVVLYQSKYMNEQLSIV
jgi:hypothetical protein